VRSVVGGMRWRSRKRYRACRFPLQSLRRPPPKHVDVGRVLTRRTRATREITKRSSRCATSRFALAGQDPPYGSRSDRPLPNALLSLSKGLPRKQGRASKRSPARGKAARLSRGLGRGRYGAWLAAQVVEAAQAIALHALVGARLRANRPARQCGIARKRAPCNSSNPVCNASQPPRPARSPHRSLQRQPRQRIQRAFPIRRRH
jgi:hypothetical protein